MGVKITEYMAPIGQLTETLDNGHRVQSSGGGKETSPRSPCLTGQPIKNYGPALHVLGRGEKFHPAFFIGEPPDNILILC